MTAQDKQIIGHNHCDECLRQFEELADMRARLEAIEKMLDVEPDRDAEFYRKIAAEFYEKIGVEAPAKGGVDNG